MSKITDPLFIASFSAAIIAMVAAMFGVGMARLMWADDLKLARHIDATRNKTETSMQAIIDTNDEIIQSNDRTIASLQKTVSIMKETIAVLEKKGSTQ